MISCQLMQAPTYALYGTGSVDPVESIPEVKNDIIDPDPEPIRTTVSTASTPVVTTTTAASDIEITPDVNKITINKTHSSNEQWETWYWHELGVKSTDKVTKIEVAISGINGSVGQWQGAFGTTSDVGNWIQTDNLTYNFDNSGIVTWEVSPADSAVINYNSGELRFGTWYCSGGDFMIDSITIYKESEVVVTTTTSTTSTTTTTTTTSTRPTTTTTTTTSTKPTTTTTTTSTKPTTTTTTTTSTKPVETTTITTPQPIKGDVNNDGRIEIADLVSMQFYLLGRNKLTAEEEVLADINDDIRVDVYDLVLLRQMLLKNK